MTDNNGGLVPPMTVVPAIKAHTLPRYFPAKTKERPAGPSGN